MRNRILFTPLLTLIFWVSETLARTADTTFVCNDDQAWDGIQCIDCSPGCSCGTSLLEGYCDDCNDGYMEYNPTSATMTLGSTVCLSCSPECGPNCCFNYKSSVQVCSDCQDAYYLSTWFCMRCLDPNCQTCAMNGVCTECAKGYFLNSIGICQPCVGSKCETCGSAGTCKTCPSGYYVNDDTGNCVACTGNGSYEQGCITCNPDIPTKCLDCNSYMYVDGQGKCREVAYCDDIEAVGESCNFCTDGYYLNALGKCTICPQSRVARCSSSTTIIQCASGNALTKDGSACVTRIKNCTQYENTGLCSKCDVNILMISSGQCYSTCAAAIPHCASCVTGTDALPATCSACNAGYFLGAGSTSCISCGDGNFGGLVGCATCSAGLPFTCSTCLSGFFFNAGTCTGCTPDLKGTGCSTCSSPTVCSACLTNSFTSLGTCNLCDVSCTTCTDRGYKFCSGTSCVSDSYYLDNTTECHKCKEAMPGCSKCSSKTTCTLCKSSYFLSSDSTLVGTSAQCQRFDGCKVRSPGLACLLCKPGYELLNNGCVECQTQDCAKTCLDESNIIVIGSPLSFTFSGLLFVIFYLMFG